MNKIDVQVQGIDNSIDSDFQKLNELIRNSIPTFKDETFENALAERSIYYIIRSLIYSAKYIKTKSIYEDNDIYSIENIQLLIQSKFDFDDFNNLNTITNILKSIIDNIPTNKIKGRLSRKKSHKGMLHKYARENNLRCYVCGSEVDYYNEDADNYREFEHLVPVSLGGNKNIKNIFISCKRCNRAKKNYINWVESDFHIKHQIFVNIEKNTTSSIENETEKELFYEEKMENQITDELLFMVCSLHKYKCSMCLKENDVSSKTYIIKKEENDYCHLFNLMTICEECLSSIEGDLMSMDNYITRVRISNVTN